MISFKLENLNILDFIKTPDKIKDNSFFFFGNYYVCKEINSGEIMTITLDNKPAFTQRAQEIDLKRFPIPKTRARTYNAIIFSSPENVDSFLKIIPMRSINFPSFSDLLETTLYEPLVRESEILIYDRL